MITYVDYVDYDGPAYRAGMREGDVILSINGTDMEKADHKTLVGYIKNCDTRMRMVVLFEDCVRKVELHMRYIQLQRILQSKMTELEKLCLRERQLLEGKWKTHSLPARKKNQNKSENVEETSASQTPTYSYCRPTVSTEDVAAKTVVQPQPAQPTLILAYQYLDPRYRYMLQPSTSSSGEYLLTFEQPANDRHHFIVKTPCETKPSSNTKSHSNHNGTTGTTKQKKSSEHSYAGHLCNPCLQPSNNSGDNTSLEAYDLASPCCDPHCVPSARRRSRHKKRDSKSEETQTDPPPRARPHSTSSQTQTPTLSSTKSLPKGQGQGQSQAQGKTQSQTQTMSGPRRYFQLGAGLVSQCSLHSCTSSEFSGMAPTTTGETTSYTTSLSTDTLYWDGSELNSTKSISKVGKPSHQYIPPEPIYVQYPVKPKSWDNLATKAFGGYGFGYGYVDGNAKSATHSTANSKKKIQYVRAHSTSTDKHYATIAPSPAGSQRRYIQTNKSTESLLSVPGTGSSCECIDTVSPNHETAEGRFFQSPRQSVVSPSDPNFGYYSARRTQTYPRNVVSTSSEATRL